MTAVTVVLDGNIVADPEMRYTPNGIAVSSFTVACNERSYNTQTKEWEDKNVVYMRCTAWRDTAETTAEQLRRGMAVVVTGVLVQNTWQDKDGNNRTTIETRVKNVAVRLVPANPTVQQEDPAVPAATANPGRTRAPARQR